MKIIVFPLIFLLAEVVCGQNSGLIHYKFSTTIKGESGKSGITTLHFSNDTTYFLFDNLKYVPPIEDKHTTIILRSSDLDGYPVIQIKNSNKQYQKAEIFLGKKCVIEDTITNIIWTKYNETKEIKGYKVYKASTVFGGRTYTAWYCPSIPIPIGPWKLHGLPGLIMDAYTTDASIFFTIEDLLLNNLKENKTSELTNNLLKNQKRIISYQKYLESQKEFMNNTKKMDDSWWPDGIDTERQMEKHYLFPLK
jgi:GLPGLI family protein